MPDHQNADEAADQAIDRSTSYTDIVEINDEPGLRLALLARCDDNVETHDGEGEKVEEFWGFDDDGNAWRVHVRRLKE